MNLTELINEIEACIEDLDRENSSEDRHYTKGLLEGYKQTVEALAPFIRFSHLQLLNSKEELLKFKIKVQKIKELLKI